MTEVLQELKTKPNRLVQLTDSHLFANVDREVVGLRSEESFQDVLELIGDEESSIKAILCTGDIAQDASVEAYRRFHASVSTLNTPQYWIPGNHDLIGNMHKAMSEEHACLSKSFSMGGWHIIMLNSCVEGEVHGVLAETELAFLTHELELAKKYHVLVCLHHNCIPVKADWLQQHALQNTEAFFQVIDHASNVRGITFGHVHQDMVVHRKGVKITATPSSSIQFHPENDLFTLDHANPGYRWFDLYPDGSLETGVKRVQGKQYNIDFSSLGY